MAFSAVEREGVNVGRQAFREIAIQSWLLTLVEIRSHVVASREFWRRRRLATWQVAVFVNLENHGPEPSSAAALSRSSAIAASSSRFGGKPCQLPLITRSLSSKKKVG